MDTQWPRRGFALLVLFLLFGVALGVPAMATTGGDMEAVLDEYEELSEAKLGWLDEALENAETQPQRRQAYNHARSKLTVYADQAVGQLAEIAGSDPELMLLAAELTQLITALKQEYLAEAAAMFDEASQTTTTTAVPPTSTTSTTVPEESTTTTSTTLAEEPTTTTTSTTLAPKPSTTTTTTRPPVTSTTSTTSTTVVVPSQPTAPPPADPPPADTPPSVLPAAPAADEPASTPGDFAGDFSDAPLDSDSDGVFSQLGSKLAAEGTLVDGIEDTEALPMTGMLAKYVPAGLPSTFATPTVGFLAIFEMVAGAFIASFKQLGGPAAAASTYLGYSVWRYLVARF